MVIAALCAEGRSTIGNIGQIDRGYERIDERLQRLGVQRSSGWRRRSGARIPQGSGSVNVSTGCPVLDHLLAELARAGGFDLALEIEPDDPEAEVDAGDRTREGGRAAARGGRLGRRRRRQQTRRSRRSSSSARPSARRVERRPHRRSAASGRISQLGSSTDLGGARGSPSTCA